MVRFNELRPCMVQGVRALFHGWAEIEIPNMEDGKQVGRSRTVNAVVELEDGSIRTVSPSKVCFADSAELFKGFTWED